MNLSHLSFYDWVNDCKSSSSDNSQPPTDEWRVYNVIFSVTLFNTDKSLHVYSVISLYESGLPTGSYWYVNIGKAQENK